MIKDLNRIATDPLRTDIILAKKVLWSTEGVTGSERLLTCAVTQPWTSEGVYTRFSTENGKTAALLLDFGCEFAGGVQIVVKTGSVRTGSHVRLRFGESAAEAMASLGEKGSCCDHSIREMEVVLPWNSCSRFGQTGYRFLYMELTEPESSLLITAVQGVFTYRDMPYLGSFQCDDELLNRIYDTCAYTVHLNMQGMLWDGIKRDRLVWIGDMHPEVLTIRTVFGDNRLVDECLRQTAANFPLPDWPNHMTTYGMWYILILWDWYLYNGRTALLEELGGYWRKLLDALAELVHDNGGKALHEEELIHGFFLDWPTNGLPDAEAGVSALLGITLSAGEQLCHTVGDEILARKCCEKRERLHTCPTAMPNMKQCIAMQQLAGQIADEDAARALLKGGGEGMSTFMSAYILKAAKHTAGGAAALAMLKEYYGGMLQAGATTFWEDFDLAWLKEGAGVEHVLDGGKYDIHGDNGRFCYQGFRHSLCHGWSAGPAAFLAEDILGIRILEPGCKRIAVEPDLGELQWARGTYPTPFGVLKISVKRDGGKIFVEYDAPKEIEIITKD